MKKQIGVLTLIVSNLQSEGKVKTEDSRKALPPGLEKPEEPEDPATAEVQPNKRTLIEVKIDKQPLGCVVVGGRDSYVTTGVIITHIYEKGAIALDNRLQMFDQIIEFNGMPLNAADMSTLKVYQYFNLAYDSVSLIVWRSDPPEWETIQLDVSRKTGKDLGLAMVPNPKGIVVVNITSASCADIDGRLQIGDVINKLNGDCLEEMTFAESCALLKAATGKINFEIIRPKPTARR